VVCHGKDGEPSGVRRGVGKGAGGMEKVGAEDTSRNQEPQLKAVAEQRKGRQQLADRRNMTNPTGEEPSHQKNPRSGRGTKS